MNRQDQPVKTDVTAAVLPRTGLVLKIIAVFALIMAANIGGAWVVDRLAIEFIPEASNSLQSMVMISAFIYTILIAIPFVPGIEIGIALLIVAGPSIALLIYCATVAGLFTSYLIGYILPETWVVSGLRKLYLRRSAALLAEMAAMDKRERIAFLGARVPGRILPVVLQYRYVALALSLNIPGNALIGGGGGISLLAGCSKLYSPPAFLVTLMAAVAPVPLVIALAGGDTKILWGLFG